VDLNTGEFIIFDEETSPDIIVDSLISSSSIPFFFTPVKLNNSVLVDGGVFTNLDMSEAIIKCKDLGYKEENIIVDVVMCFDKVVDIESWSKD
jgi:predicted acylesterase/phospholipase RssA